MFRKLRKHVCEAEQTAHGAHTTIDPWASVLHKCPGCWLLQNLMTTLVAQGKHLKQLHLLTGRPQAGSQLPSYNPPAWLRVRCISCTAFLALSCLAQSA
jgi:hypothetical protein